VRFDPGTAVVGAFLRVAASSNKFVKRERMDKSDLDSIIDLIDVNIEMADRGLTKSQPPMSGKIRVMWFSRETQKIPRLVEWKRYKTGLWRAKILPTRRVIVRAKIRGSFQRNLKETRELLKHVQWLLELRVEVNRRRANMQKSVQVRRIQLAEVMEQLTRLDKACEAKSILHMTGEDLPSDNS
jgi:hypothetical protein